jgi:ABC-type lipoprotein release transport system permease subunit
MLMMIAGFVLCGFTIGWTEGAYDNLINRFTRVWTGHIQVHADGYLERPGLYRTIDRYGKILGAVRSTGGVEGAAPRILAAGLGSIGDKSSGVRIVGIEPESEHAATGFNNRIESGEPFGAGADSTVILGTGLAGAMEAQTGDSLVIISQSADGSMASGIYRIRGTYSTGNEATDMNSVYMHLDDAQTLFALSGSVHEILVVCETLQDVEPAARRLREKLKGMALDVATWPEINPVFYRSMKSDKAGAYYSYAIIVIIVAVGVLNTVLMSVMERRKEYGVMKALGTRPAQIVGMIYLELGSIAAASSIAGAIITFALLQYFSVHGISGFGEMTIGGITVTEYPTRVIPAAFYVPVILIFISAGLVAAYPAVRAARVDAAKAMSTK